MKTETEVKNAPTKFVELFGRGLKADGNSLLAEFFVGFGSTKIQSEIVTEKIGHVNSVEQAAFIVKAVSSFDALLEFAQKHHEVCGECEGTGKIYNNADPTSGQWVYCPYAEAIGKAQGE